jgi:hypothetical protein
MTADLGESVVKLSSTLQQLDFFTAPEWRSLNANDTDLGSIAPTILQNGWIFQSEKNGKGYLISGATMGHVGANSSRLRCATVRTRRWVVGHTFRAISPSRSS